MEVDLWTFRMQHVNLQDISLDVAYGLNLRGFNVRARDGSVGKVDHATYEAGQSYLIVEVGSRLFRKKVVVPAGVVEEIDLEKERVHVHRLKDQLGNAPLFDCDKLSEEAYRAKVERYFGPRGAGFIEWIC